MKIVFYTTIPIIHEFQIFMIILVRTSFFINQLKTDFNFKTNCNQWTENKLYELFHFIRRGKR